MMSIRDLYLTHVGQTSDMPMMLEIERAAGVYIYTKDGKRYYDMNSGIAVSSLGHCHPIVTKAIVDQVHSYMHTMVYGEHVQSPQVLFAQKLLSFLDASFESIYYLTAGTEATELAMKIAKRHTGRFELISCASAYHGSTQGSESLRSDKDYKAPYLPLVPGIRHVDFNNHQDLQKITCRTAGVICEVVQGEVGVRPPDKTYLPALRERCTEVGTLLIFDEIQSGFGRTGRLFAHQEYNIIPDILLVGKAMGGGMPLSGVISSKDIMDSIVRNPALGHITTFGGHPVSCAAALASLNVLIDEDLISKVQQKEDYIKSTLASHSIVKEVRSAGLMMAVETTKRKYLKHVVSRALELGVIVDWFLFNNRSFRLAPPLVISLDELRASCDLLLQALDYAASRYG